MNHKHVNDTFKDKTTEDVDKSFTPEKRIADSLDNIKGIEMSCYWGWKGDGFSIEAKVVDDKVNVKSEHNGFFIENSENLSTDDFLPNADDVKSKKSLINLLKKIRIQSWEQYYRPKDYFVLDGMMWNLKIKCDSAEFSWEGNDVFPDIMPIFLDYFNFRFDKLFNGQFDYELFPVRGKE